LRPPDWPERLARYVTAARTRAFEWGISDCCAFARGAVLAIGGPDMGEGWARTYSDEDGARAAIRSLGRDLEYAVETMAGRVGLAEVGPRMAQRGDLLVVRDQKLIGGMPLAAICEGRDALSTATTGLIKLPMRVAVRAWAVE
jgi:hypothetical protein